ncbi:YdeI/OmpD-associated family protein [Sphingosinicella sp. LHD-64]|uniref:YdeI/OmpD-associated family protein n=1 Tax=Sphingosinicella sp. LHD-64 TaxID=3072139 RepID=UPI00280F2BED|nr:YdeI/OmpD-associated family protein [Sphingosinicella sp. LHD-64]MDQ8758267.1 YdeI/OmpD-associated family protein [Sphingosinicella sp. LHD-64]
MKTDPRMDAYIARQADFARPILEHLRAVVHAACPEGEEAMKWSAPTFLYKGQMLAGMAAFKAHATFGFWKGGLVTGDTAEMMSAMGQFGRLTAIDDLPDRATLEALIRKAMALTDEGVKAPRNKHPKAPFDVPGDLRAALDGNAAAAATFDGFPPSSQRDYVEWVTEAKREETRAKRVAQAVEWLAEGKKRHWKYENC